MDILLALIPFFMVLLFVSLGVSQREKAQKKKMLAQMEDMENSAADVPQEVSREVSRETEACSEDVEMFLEETGTEESSVEKVSLSFEMPEMPEMPERPKRPKKSKNPEFGELVVDVPSEFSWRDAVIYDAILNRKEY